MSEPVNVELVKTVSEKYGAIARQVRETKSAEPCCGPTCCSGTAKDPISANLYDETQAAAVPGDAILASLGCGNPTALAELKAGEVVLDLGSGGGIDVLLSARRVGPTGKAYGLDMTDDMLALALENKAKSGLTNVEFLKGHIENIPLPSATVDVIISNCVINLSGNKDRVMAEAFRVLKPGGRFAVSDVVVLGDVPPDLRRNMELWVGCIAGALRDTDYASKLRATGFTGVSVEPWRVYNREDMPEAHGQFAAAFIRATKPVARRSFCDTACCA